VQFDCYVHNALFTIVTVLWLRWHSDCDAAVKSFSWPCNTQCLRLWQNYQLPNDIIISSHFYLLVLISISCVTELDINKLSLQFGNRFNLMPVAAVDATIIRPHQMNWVQRCSLCCRCSMVCMSVCVCWTQPWALQNGLTNRHAIWVVDSGGHKEPCIRWGPRSSQGKGQFWGDMSHPIEKYRQSLQRAAEKRLTQSTYSLSGPNEQCISWGPRSPQAVMGGVVSHIQMHCNSKSCENGNINYTIYIPTDIVWPQQYTGVIHSQTHICIYAKKQFETTNFSNCRMETVVMSQSHSVS